MNRMWLKGLVLLVGVSLSGCASGSPISGSHPGESELMGTTWLLVSLQGETIELRDEAQRPYFTLEPEESRLAGFTGCNRMFGNFEIEGDRLSFKPIGVTKMACIETMELERAFLETIQATSRWKLERETLELIDTQGVSLAALRSRTTP